ncbi:SPX and EXS domain-containing protein 1 [Quillaja saponaria]|uniref:SPX and EXS domain-containing protein 1 n=1 Tax=Quillaja saponaria TaxID=32244 RepID=A0AAD7LQ55_QUISA|nr:SPX and EXS domain-containing protein 1 [Quillaja saponaria]
MEKMFSDLERSVFRMVNRQVATIAWLESDSVVVVTQYLSVLPYIWRLLQRLRQYKDTKERTSIFNENKWNKITRSRRQISMNEIPREYEKVPIENIGNTIFCQQVQSSIKVIHVRLILNLYACWQPSVSCANFVCRKGMNITDIDI